MVIIVLCYDSNGEMVVESGWRQKPHGVWDPMKVGVLNVTS